MSFKMREVFLAPGAERLYEKVATAALGASADIVNESQTVLILLTTNRVF
jgi:hypothetical protein